MVSAADKLRLEGLRIGEEKGERNLLKKQIKNKFKQLDDELIDLIDTADINIVEKVAQIFYKFDDIEELKQQLKK